MRKNRKSHLAATISCLLCPLAAMADVNNSANISTGSADEAGIVTTYITLTKKVNGKDVYKAVEWNTSIDKGDDGSSKADKIRSSAPPDSPYIEKVSGDSNTVSAKAKDGWTITSMDFSADETKEKHTHNVFSTFEASVHTGVFSLTGDSVATGLDSDGGQGHIDVSLLDEMIRVDTLPGMTGDDMEGLIAIELVALGIDGSLEGPGFWMDRFDLFSGAPHDDQMVFFHELDSLGLTIDVADTGLVFDISGLFIPAPGSLLLLGVGGLTVLRRRR